MPLFQNSKKKKKYEESSLLRRCSQSLIFKFYRMVCSVQTARDADEIYACCSHVIFRHADKFPFGWLSANFYSRSLHRPGERQLAIGHTYAVAASTELSLECV